MSGDDRAVPNRRRLLEADAVLRTVRGVLRVVPLEVAHRPPVRSYALAKPRSSFAAFRGGHPGVKLEQLFQPLGVVAEAAPDIDAFQDLVVPLMRRAQIGGHRVRIV